MAGVNFNLNFGAAGTQFRNPISNPPFQQIGGNPQLQGQFQALLTQLLSALTQLVQGYQGFAGGGQPGGFPQQPGGFPQQPGFPPQGGFPGPQPFPGGGFPGSGPAGPTPQYPFGGMPSPGTPIFGGPQPFPGYPGGPFQPGGPVGPNQPQPGQVPPANFDFAALNNQQRTQVSGLNDHQRGVLHLWGIQMTSAGKQNGGIYFNVLNNPEQFKPAEVALVRDLYQKEMTMFGGVTGKLLDQQFFGLYQGMTGKDISQRYGNAPVEFANGPVNMANRTNGQNGLSQFDNAVIRLWGHDPLDNGKIDGSIAQYTLGSNNAFDRDLNQGDIQALLAADVADNGVRDGTSLENAFIDSLDRLYFGAPGANQQKTLGRAGINQTQVGGILQQLAQNPPPGVPPGVDITNMNNIGKCPVLGPMVQQQGGVQFGGFG